MFISLYVDDILIAGNEMETLQTAKNELSNKFYIKELGESHVIFGMDIVRDRKAGTVTICQSRYAEKVLN